MDIEVTLGYWWPPTQPPMASILAQEAGHSVLLVPWLLMIVSTSVLKTIEVVNK